MTILVTRPLPAGKLLVERLRKLGQPAFHSPLIDFYPGLELPSLPARLMALRAGDMLFALSQHSVRYASAALNQAGFYWPTAPAYYAIGRTTALALQQAASHIVAFPPERESSEMLLQLPELQNISGKNALLLRGNGGRELLANTLAERGARVSYCECYQRGLVYYDGPEQSRYWQKLGIDRLVITSGDILQQLYALVPNYYRESWLLHCQIIVVSERLSLEARQLGWHNVLITNHADNDTLVRLLS